MAKDKEEVKETEDEIGLVTIRQDTGVGIRMPDGQVIDLTGIDGGTSQVLAYLVKSISELKKQI